MSYTFFEGQPPRLTINPDCPDARVKKLAVFAADSLTAGVTAPSDLDPHNFEPVEKVLAPGTTRDEVALFMGRIGLEERK